MVFLDRFSIQNHLFRKAWDFGILWLLLLALEARSLELACLKVPGPRPALIEGCELIGWARGRTGILLEAMRKRFLKIIQAWDFLIAACFGS